MCLYSTRPKPYLISLVSTGTHIQYFEYAYGNDVSSIDGILNIGCMQCALLQTEVRLVLNNRKFVPHFESKFSKAQTIFADIQMTIFTQ